jgi:hypothetical protein
MAKENNLPRGLLIITRISLITIVISFFGLFLYFFQPSWFNFNLTKEKDAKIIHQEGDEATSTDLCLNCARRLLDGVMVPPEETNLRPYAVMIDNFSNARPQSGLSSASLVYEAPAEGGVTRYLAFFDPKSTPLEIGPVRSARAYFLNWAKELGATYVHVGGSPEALELAKSINKSDLNEFYNSKYFSRSPKRVAPHNVMTTISDLENYRLDKNETGITINPWQFKDLSTSTETIVSKISIKYSSGYDVYWNYNLENNNYERYLDGSLHKDSSGEKISANNLIVQIVSFKITDDKLRLELSSALSGQALLCQDGNCQMGNWKKNSSNSRAKYYYKNGEEFIFNAGPTWIEINDNLQNIKY